MNLAQETIARLRVLSASVHDLTEPPFPVIDEPGSAHVVAFRLAAIPPRLQVLSAASGDVPSKGNKRKTPD